MTDQMTALAPNPEEEPENGHQNPPEFSNPDDIDAVAQVILDFLMFQATATRTDIRNYCNAAGISTKIYQSAMTRLKRQFNLITEVFAPDGGKAWEVKEWARGKRLSELVAIQMNMAAEKAEREHYSDWYQSTGLLTFTTASLASCPDPGDPSNRLFVRDVTGKKIIYLSGYFRGMLRQAAALPHVPRIGATQYQIRFRQQMADASLIRLVLKPVPPARPGGKGQGVTSCESLPAGAQLPFEAIVPGSHVTPEEWEELMEEAGQFCGISPSAARLGWGRFEVQFNPARRYA